MVGFLGSVFQQPVRKWLLPKRSGIDPIERTNVYDAKLRRYFMLGFLTHLARNVFVKRKGDHLLIEKGTSN